MHTYSTAEIARILDVRPAWIRAQARRSLVAPKRNARGHYRYSFQDMVLLRAAQSLKCAHVSSMRIAQTFCALSAQLPPGRSLSSLQLRREGQSIVAADASTAWDAETGQTVLVFDPPQSADTVAPLDRELRLVAARHAGRATDWFLRGLELERMEKPLQAEAAYRHACKLDPQHVNARINLGRLRHAAKALEEAEVLYREALSIEPEHSIALFNLGVVLEDRGIIDAAIECYELSIASDPEIAEAHYNLARLYARHREESAAVRHYSRYKALTRETDL